MKNYKIPCSKCEGKGIIQGYAMVAGGTCFQCKGSGCIMGNKSQYEYYLKRLEEKELINEQRKEYRNLNDRSEWIRKNIENILNIKKTTDIKTNEDANKLYKMLKDQVKKDLSDYKKYKLTYNAEITEIELILKEFNIKCV